MRNLRSQSPPSLLLILLLVLSLYAELARIAEGAKRRIEIPDELDDVVDDEEDEAWKEWGKKKSPSLDLHPSELDKMEMPQIQAELMKRNSGPVFGFVKLQLGIRRSKETVGEIAMKWTKILRSGSLGTRFSGVDTGTLMFTMESGGDLEELKEFILSQPDAYEIKIGDRAFRRPGDPPVEEVLDRLMREREEKDEKHVKEEL